MRRKTFKLPLLAFVGIMSASMLVGCSSSNKSDAGKSDSGNSNEVTKEASDGESKEIIYWGAGSEEPDKSIYEFAVNKFNENTDSGYKITYVPMKNDTYKEKLIIAMSSNECPDLYMSWSGGPMIEYVKAGYAQPVTDLVKEYKLDEKLMDAGLAQGTYEGDVYAIPLTDVAISGIYYNKDIFDKYGLEVPKTVSELEAVCDTLVENGIVPFALANASKWTGSMYFMNLATRFGGLEPFQNAVSGKGSFEDESFVYAGQKIQDWVNKGYFPEGVNSLSEDDGQSRQLLYQESAAMTCIGSWYTSVIKSDSEEFYNKLGWFPFPAVDESKADPSIIIGTIGDMFLSFNCKDDKLKAAFEMATYYSDEDCMDYMVEKGKIPPVKGVTDKVTEPISKTILEAATNASATQLWYDQYLPPAVAEVHKDTCQELFGLSITPEEANKQLQEAMQGYLSQK